MISLLLLLVGLDIIILIGAAWGLARFSGELSSGAPNARKGPVLTRFMKRTLDFIWYFLIVVAVLYPLLTIGIGLELFFDADRRYIDIFLGFRLYPDAMPDTAALSSSAADAFVRGHSLVQINTASNLALYLSAAVAQVNVVIFLYGLAQMRAILASLVGGQSFAQEIPRRIRNIGFVLIGWLVLTPFLQYISGRAILGEVENALATVKLYPAFELNLLGIIIGLALIVLAGVWREAIALHEEQSLTI